MACNFRMSPLVAVAVCFGITQRFLFLLCGEGTDLTGEYTGLDGTYEGLGGTYEGLGGGKGSSVEEEEEEEEEKKVAAEAGKGSSVEEEEEEEEEQLEVLTKIGFKELPLRCFFFFGFPKSDEVSWSVSERTQSQSSAEQSKSTGSGVNKGSSFECDFKDQL